IIISKSGDIRMEDIAEKAGVAIGTLYNYFDNRQKLIDTIIEKRRNMADSYIRHSLDQTEGLHICARMENLFLTLFNFLERHRSVTHHSLQLKEIHESKTGKKSLMSLLNDYAQDMLQSALERGEIRSEHMDIYPLVISAYLKSIFAKVEEQHDTRQNPDLARRLAELFYYGACDTEATATKSFSGVR
ncbi:MAG: TetR/AcrR family transcriptional regulator, partial [Candidatus Cloacimonadaceae bacterium]|nr:TetR/AcrR family transcriptional regulator [Candidatus Cloacimonadaceae bacterium]